MEVEFDRYNDDAEEEKYTLDELKDYMEKTFSGYLPNLIKL